jgi:hypothetical protein
MGSAGALPICSRPQVYYITLKIIGQPVSD